MSKKKQSNEFDFSSPTDMLLLDFSEFDQSQKKNELKNTKKKDSNSSLQEPGNIKEKNIGADSELKDSENVKEVKNKRDEKISKFVNLCYFELITKGILSMSDVFDISIALFPKKVWSSPFLDFLSHTVVSDGRISRIDLALPSSKPLAIYPGHHSVSSTSFFCLSTDNSNEKLAEAENILSRLCNEAIAKNQGKSKSKKKSSKKGKNDPNSDNVISPKSSQIIDLSNDPEKASSSSQINDENDLFIGDEIKKISRTRNVARNYQAKIRWGVIVPKRIKIQIISLIICQHFGTTPFSSQDFFDLLSIDTYIKIFGVKDLPQIYITEPRLRFLLIKQLPKSYLDIFEIEEAKKYFETHFLQHLMQDILIYDQEKNLYQLRPSIRLETPFSVQKCNLIDPNDMIMYNRFIQHTSLMEFVDPHTSDLWRKRFSICRAQDKYSLAIYKYEVTNGDGNIPVFFPEIARFCHKTGIEWPSIKAKYIIFNEYYLPHLTTAHYPEISSFCGMKHQLENQQLIFDMDPRTIFEEKNKEDFSDLINTEGRVLLAHFAALCHVTLEGTVVMLPRPWSKIEQLIESLGSSTISDRSVNLHAYSLGTFRDYRDLFWETIANSLSFIISSKYFKIHFKENLPLENLSYLFKIQEFNFNFSHDSNQFDFIYQKLSECLVEFIPLTTTQLIKFRSITNIKLNFSPLFGELIERLRMITLTPPEFFYSRKARRLIAEIDWSLIQNAVYYLKASRFLSQKTQDDEAETGAPYVFSRRNVTELRNQRPSSFYQIISESEKTVHMLKLSTISPAGVFPNSPSLCAYFLSKEPSDLCVSMLILPHQTQANKELSLLGMSSFINRSPDQSAENLDMVLYRLPYPLLSQPQQQKSNQQNSLFNHENSNSNNNDSNIFNSDLSLFEVNLFINNNELNSSNPHTPQTIQDEKDKSHSKRPPVADALLYPEDLTVDLSKVFMELFVLIYQIRTKNSNELIFSARRVYACIFSKQVEGTTLEEIQKECPEQASFEALNILLEFEYVISVNSCSATPLFIAEPFSIPHLVRGKKRRIKPHYWIMPNGEMNSELKTILMRHIVEVIDENEGIEILELSEKMPSVGLRDLIHLVDLLELDEVISTIWSKTISGDLFNEDLSIPTKPLSIELFLNEVKNQRKNPNFDRVLRRLYITKESPIRLANSTIV